MAMTTIHVDIVSAEREIFSGAVQMVFAPALLGEVGIAPGHAPLLTTLAPGEVRLDLGDGRQEGFYVSGGILEVQPRVVTILSDTAARSEDLDEAALIKARQAVAETLHTRGAGIDYARARAELAETAAQLRAIERLRSRVQKR